MPGHRPRPQGNLLIYHDLALACDVLPARGMVTASNLCPLVGIDTEFVEVECTINLDPDGLDAGRLREATAHGDAALTTDLVSHVK